MKDLQLGATATATLLALVGPRYDADNNELQLTSHRFPTREANKLYLANQLQQLLAAAKDPESQKLL